MLTLVDIGSLKCGIDFQRIFICAVYVSPQISSGEIETLLQQLPNMFKQEFTGVGATLEKKWKFCGFEGIKCVSQ